jgi:chorismate dehydratase
MSQPEASPSSGPADPVSGRALPRPPRAEPRFEIDPEEDLLEQTLSGFRVGSVPYLNAVPLTRGIEDQVLFVPPKELAALLRKGKLDAALLSVTEALFCDDYDILDGICIGSRGEVKSVYLAHTQPLEEITQIHLDPASLTSVNLLRVLLAERGSFPDFIPLLEYDADLMPDNVLLIGDPAIRYLRTNPERSIWDLGAAWDTLTGLPFVYAVWVLWRDKDTTDLRRILHEAADFGLETLDDIIRDRSEFDRAFRQDYLGGHIRYMMGADEKRGLARFAGMIAKFSGQEVFESKFVL